MTVVTYDGMDNFCFTLSIFIMNFLLQILGFLLVRQSSPIQQYDWMLYMASWPGKLGCLMSSNLLKFFDCFQDDGMTLWNVIRWEVELDLPHKQIFCLSPSVQGQNSTVLCCTVSASKAYWCVYHAYLYFCKRGRMYGIAQHYVEELVGCPYAYVAEPALALPCKPSISFSGISDKNYWTNPIR